MVSTQQFAHPVQTLRDNIAGLKTAIALVLVNPKKKAVHRLRTTARRIEAQLTLLEQIAQLSKHAGPARKATRLLRKFRRAAGKVHDLDIQRDLLKNPQQLKRAINRPSNSEPFSQAFQLNRHLVQDTKSLRKTLKYRREAEAHGLVRMLRRHHVRLSRALGNLLEALVPPESLTVSAARVFTLTRDWYHRELRTRSKPNPTPDELHAIRKSAKLARYIAESSLSAKPQQLARVFEDLQQSGGTWHDLLQLHEVAQHELGKDSPVTKSLARMTESTVRDYRRKLADPIPGGTLHRQQLVRAPRTETPLDPNVASKPFKENQHAAKPARPRRRVP
ncbi:MAG: CHAD domain-containing protein [Acidobacteriota bacterium]|nr:CHAD domain-containing protein [Acidobacteriota bacterium]